MGMIDGLIPTLEQGVDQLGEFQACTVSHVYWSSASTTTCSSLMGWGKKKTQTDALNQRD